MISSEIVLLLRGYTDDILRDRTVIFLRARNNAPEILGYATPAVVDRFIHRVLAFAQKYELAPVNEVSSADAGDQIIANEVLKSLSSWAQSSLRGAEAWQLAINFFLLPPMP